MTEKTSSPTIADVAREAGVSISTVSRFLNGSTLLAGETEIRVRDAIRRLGYSPRSAARNLALRRTNTLGLLIEAIGTAFFADVVSGAEAAAYEEGYNLLIATRTHINNGALPVLGPFNTDGLLMVCIPMTDTLATLAQHGYPIVSLYQPAPKSMNIPLVTIENRRGTFLIVDHLISVHGMKRIGFLRGPSWNKDASQREQGYRQAFRKNGLEINEALLGVGEFSFPKARKTVLDWHKKGILPQAIFAGNDESAMDVILTLYEIGMRVPDDVAVVGFDDTSLATNLVPPLTTVKAPIEAVGREGIHKLLELLRTGKTDLVTQLPTELVVRRSCGCNAQMSQTAGDS